MNLSEDNCNAGDVENVRHGDEDANIVKSPLAEMAKKLVIPEVPFTTFLFDSLKRNYDFLKDKILAINVLSGTSIRFNEVEKLAKQFASALTRKGFKKGDVLYFVTYDTAYLYVVELGVWLCGGAVRGCFQNEEIKEYELQMREVSSRFILIEKETAEKVKLAADSLGWPIEYLSLGEKIEGATPVEDMIFMDDGSALPKNVNINPKEDVLYIPTTNGTTGFPKGVMHTHYGLVSMLTSAGLPTDLKCETRFGQCSVLCLANFSILSFLRFYYSLMIGETYINIPKFDPKTFLQYINKYKPDSLHFFPYVTNWLLHCTEMDNYDFTFIKRIVLGGSILDVATLKQLSARLPHVRVHQIYGMTELLSFATEDSWHCAKIESSENCDRIAGLKLERIDDEVHVSCGVLVPFAEAKIVDVNSGVSVGRRIKGKLLVRTPHVMKGYVRNSTKEFVSELDAEGWFDTGDIAFFDNSGHLYIVDRLKSMFKYYSHHVYPTEIEALINEHPAVSASAVVGVPNPKTGYVARAYVVLKPGFQVTEEGIKEHVAKKTIFYKHLHGGVDFIEKMPKTRGGKLDKKSLLQKAIAEMRTCT